MRTQGFQNSEKFAASYGFQTSCIDSLGVDPEYPNALNEQVFPPAK